MPSGTEARTGVSAKTAWAAVLRRDPRYDGRFVTAVETTGIYCRASCPARRPLRENVRFLASPAAARAAGFRACMRCTPDRAHAPAPRWVAAACALFGSRAVEGVRVSEVARAVGVSPSHFARAFRKHVGVSPRDYANERRLRRAEQSLAAGVSVTTAIYDAGFGSSSRLYERSRSRLGMTPGAYRRGAVGATIRYATSRCRLGRVLVAATEAGVCTVALGDTDAALRAELGARFGGATLVRDTATLAAALRAVVGAAEHGTTPTLLLDVRATAFQRRVWDALRRIPAGETRSYLDVARSIGAPTSARAVAGACARNPLAIVVPCHRVVRGDGALGGYRWGRSRKERLLAVERVERARRPSREPAK